MMRAMGKNVCRRPRQREAATGGDMSAEDIDWLTLLVIGLLIMLPLFSNSNRNEP
jgi:hypothetical protein